jgi:glycosyltransferase involved in cell wall biosynthesis
MTAATSKIGVAIPTYNRQNYLRILLNSIPENIEVVVSDNGQTCSPEFRKEFSNRRFVGSDTVVDVVKNWNNAASNLDTEWICIASDDDVFFDGAFDTVSDYITRYPDAGIIIFGHKNIDEDGKEISKWSSGALRVYKSPDGYNFFKYGVDARVISIFFKRELYNQIGKFDEHYRVTATDSDFIQTALLTSNAVIAPEMIAGYRVWRKSMTGTLIATKEWMQEVIFWQSKIEQRLRAAKFPNREIRHNTNEVIAQNLLQAANSLYKQKKNLSFSTQFLSQFKYPVFASVKTQLQILKCLLKIALRN